jgi:hypothetical protein
MRTLFNAAMALGFVALFTGHLVPGPRWQAVAAELHQAQPRAHMQADLRALFHQKN